MSKLLDTVIVARYREEAARFRAAADVAPNRKLRTAWTAEAARLEEKALLYIATVSKPAKRTRKAAAPQNTQNA